MPTRQPIIMDEDEYVEVSTPVPVQAHIPSRESRKPKPNTPPNTPNTSSQTGWSNTLTLIPQTPSSPNEIGNSIPPPVEIPPVPDELKRSHVKRWLSIRKRHGKNGENGEKLK